MNQTRTLAASPNELDDNKLLEVEELKKAWQDMGLEAEPFDKNKVFYFLPTQRNSAHKINADLRNIPNPNSNDIREQPNNYFVYRYALPDVRGRLQYLLPHPESEAQQHLVFALDSEGESPMNTSNTFSELSNQLTGAQLEATAGTVRVVRRSIEVATNRGTSGVF